MQFDLNHDSSCNLRLRVSKKGFRFRFSKSKPQRKVVIYITHTKLILVYFYNNNPAIYCIQFWEGKKIWFVHIGSGQYLEGTV